MHWHDHTFSTGTNGNKLDFEWLKKHVCANDMPIILDDDLLPPSHVQTVCVRDPLPSRLHVFAPMMTTTIITILPTRTLCTILGGWNEKKSWLHGRVLNDIRGSNGAINVLFLNFIIAFSGTIYNFRFCFITTDQGDKQPRIPQRCYLFVFHNILYPNRVSAYLPAYLPTFEKTKRQTWHAPGVYTAGRLTSYITL